MRVYGGGFFFFMYCYDDDDDDNGDSIHVPEGAAQVERALALELLPRAEG